MRALDARPGFRLFVLCMLYVGQGIPWGFTALTLPTFLSQHHDATAVGAVSAMTVLPYAFKWVWGPIIDLVVVPRFGRRRPWIILGQGGMALTVGALLLHGDPSSDLPYLAHVVFIHTIFNALQDVAVDGLAVDQLSEADRGRANGLMYASKWGGGALGGAGLSYVIAASGMTTALVLMMLALVAIMLLPLLIRERSPEVVVARPRPLELVKELLRVFSLRSTLVCLVLMALSNVAIGILSPVGNQLYTQVLGWEPADLALLTGGIGLVIGAIGSISAGYVADRLGPRGTATIGAFLLAFAWAGFALAHSAWGSKQLALLIVVLEQLGAGIMTVAFITLSMGLSSPKVGASQFAVYMALSSVGTKYGYQYAGAALEVWTYEGVYYVCAAYQVGLLVLLLFIDPKQTRRELGVDAPAGS